jgi:ATP-dependent DNA ligase
MRLPVMPPVAPMLAKAVPSVPPADSVVGGLSYEPKWDGFRCIVFKDGDDVELGSRGTKMLTRYFPEVVEAAREHLPARCVVDAELVVRSGEPGAERLDWDTLSQRIHPADSRVRRLSVETPASLVAFDLLASGDQSLLDQSFSVRRERLEDALADVVPPVHLTRTTTDTAVATGWFSQFEGAGLDGVVAKPLAAAYQQNRRVMLKVKHSRTADAVVIGYRVHKSGQGIGSMLLGLYTDDGTLAGVGGASAFSTARRLALVDELEPYVVREPGGEAARGETDRSRFSAGKDSSFVRLRPELVVEVKYDQMENHRFRHAVQFQRWRPDREPRSCTYDQIERPLAYDLDAVLQG